MRNIAKLKPSSVLVGLLLLSLVACPQPSPAPAPVPASIPTTYPTFGQSWRDLNGSSTLSAAGCTDDQKPVRTIIGLNLDDAIAPELAGRISIGLVVPNPPPSAYVDFIATVTSAGAITGVLKAKSFSLPVTGNATVINGAVTQISASYVGPGGCVVIGGSSITGTVITQFTLLPAPPS
jgi:hypothetical protein